MYYHGLKDAALRQVSPWAGGLRYVSSSVRWLETKPSELSGSFTVTVSAAVPYGMTRESCQMQTTAGD